MDNEVADKRYKGESPALRITHGPTLSISADTIPDNMLEATVSPAAVQQDNVGKEDPDNMGKG